MGGLVVALDGDEVRPSWRGLLVGTLTPHRPWSGQ